MKYMSLRKHLFLLISSLVSFEIIWRYLVGIRGNFVNHEAWKPFCGDYGGQPSLLRCMLFMLRKLTFCHDLRVFPIFNSIVSKKG